MIKEIGSEFWETDKETECNNLDYFNMGEDIKYLMSGQTAIDYVIKNIDDTLKIVYMPEYCCETMVKPFFDNGYKVKFYKVDLEDNNYQIDEEENFSIFYAMSYFGYSITNMDVYIERLKSKGVIVIEDITHRLFQQKKYCKSSDYLVASIRKWMPVYCGGIAINVNNKFDINIDDYSIDNEFLRIRKKAMKLKMKYINNLINDKNEYLNLYEESNHKLLDYKAKLMDKESLEKLNKFDIDDMIKRRKENVLLIESLLKNNKKIKLLYKMVEEDCPLFVPVIVENRDSIRKELIENSIYCPIHWPNFNEFGNDIYDKELSLVCDQRYGLNDIENYIRKFIDIVERN